MSRRQRPLSARLNSRNSRLWCELDIGAVHVRCYLVDRASRSIPEIHDDHQGRWDPDTCIALVGWDLPEDVAVLTLVHELTHAMVFACGVKVHPDREADEEEEEQLVLALSACVCDTFRRNGWLQIPPRPALPPRARKAVAS